MVVIGLSGPKCAGKRTVAEHLVQREKFSSIVLRPDCIIAVPHAAHSQDPRRDWYQLSHAKLVRATSSSEFYKHGSAELDSAFNEDSALNSTCADDDCPTISDKFNNDRTIFEFDADVLHSSGDDQPLKIKYRPHDLFTTTAADGSGQSRQCDHDRQVSDDGVGTATGSVSNATQLDQRILQRLRAIGVVNRNETDRHSPAADDISDFYRSFDSQIADDIVSNGEESNWRILIMTTPTALLRYVTQRWLLGFVIVNLNDLQVLRLMQKRPFFMLVQIDAPLMIRWSRIQSLIQSQNQLSENKISFEEFVQMSDAEAFSHESLTLNNHAKVRIVSRTDSLSQLRKSLDRLDLLYRDRFRPGWDAYFMQIADLAASRSSCMKRRVGCVLVCDSQVIATGYNGTPRGLANCDEGGCPRCNFGSTGGMNLGTCLCLHAEENALLAAGRSRINENSVLYCNTCPCLTCSVKICQARIREVVYHASYSLDDVSATILRTGGVRLRQFTLPEATVVTL